MSDNNLIVKNSNVIRNNLNILNNSDVQNENLNLDDGINYVERFSPEILKENDMMKAIYGMQRDELENLHTQINSVIDNTFLSSVNYFGLFKWEKLLMLESNAGLDLNARKELLLLKRWFRPPFTRQNLREILVSIWGEGNFTFTINPNVFEIIIDIHTNYPEVYIRFQNYIRRLIPANMFVIFSIQYTYLYLFRHFDYNNLSSLTYNELSRYN